MTGESINVITHNFKPSLTGHDAQRRVDIPIYPDVVMPGCCLTLSEQGEVVTCSEITVLHHATLHLLDGFDSGTSSFSRTKDTWTI